VPSSKSASLISRASRTLARLLPLLVALDLGHTPAEPGALAASGRPELEFNRELALDVQAALENAGVTVRLLDTDAEVAPRLRAAEGADILVTLHHHAVKPRFKDEARYFSGFALVVSHENRGSERSLACASRIGVELKEAGFFPSRFRADEVFGDAKPFADAKDGVHYDDALALAREASMPVVMVEAGVISNRQEELRLSHPLLRRRFAEALARAVRQCMP
jgi:N-acetylmuramoyl-L-alanine amidase